ncbi:nuclear transport factor 2 family protein [Microscilla marina]|uniref:Steroid delta-isomerase domain protein n=1 Tax=Microscilla marina ATCC 23134 TaxID=313606 RepID=A1ZSL1_MICM2|nr:nuclear transport factor 2 family protein [Microscilla marina]EAY26591.1 steroid delta-isomerase domain protein [Microscilla marina ATCC 23134]
MKKEFINTKCSYLLLIFCLFTGVTQAQVGTKKNNLKETAEQVVQRQLEAYNARNIEAFMATYSDSVKLYRYPHRLISKGKKSMRKGYARMFEKVTELHCKIVKRIVLGNKVIDQERVTGFPGWKKNGPLEAVAVYTVKNGLIDSVTFIRGK